MKRSARVQRFALVGSALLTAPAASCSLEQSGLDSVLAAVSAFQGNVNIHLNVGSGGGGSGNGAGGEEEDHNDQGHDDQSPQPDD